MPGYQRKNTALNKKICVNKTKTNKVNITGEQNILLFIIFSQTVIIVLKYGYSVKILFQLCVHRVKMVI